MSKSKAGHGGFEYQRFIDLPRGSGKYLRRNEDYELWGTKYKHVEKWRAHHGIALDPKRFIIHHKDEDKRNNDVCSDTSGRCPVLNCGNLAPMTRAEHIRQHRPGRMGGTGFPDRTPRKPRSDRGRTR